MATFQNFYQQCELKFRYSNIMKVKASSKNEAAHLFRSKCNARILNSYETNTSNTEFDDGVTLEESCLVKSVPTTLNNMNCVSLGDQPIQE